MQGRRPHQSFRGLLDVHSRYGLSARRPAYTGRLSRRLRRFRYLYRRSDSYRLERPSCRVGLAPTEDQHLSTAHNRSDPAASIAVATCWWAFRGIYASTLEMWPNGYPVANSTGTQLEKIQGTWELVASEFNGNTWA